MRPGGSGRGRAFLWIGAITLALAAIFLVRYSIEEGWLSPEVRVILATIFGFVLIGVAQPVRGRDERVAQALAAAGVAALYGSLFAAVALYDMISKVAAGGGAAALTAFAIGVSLRHGILVAALAFVGGFVSPAIIGSETPNTPVLFGYLLAIAAGTLGVIRARRWWPLGWGVLAGSALWTIAWMMSIAGGLHWVGLFLVALTGLFLWFRLRVRLLELQRFQTEEGAAGALARCFEQCSAEVVQEVMARFATADAALKRQMAAAVVGFVGSPWGRALLERGEVFDEELLALVRGLSGERGIVTEG